MPVTGDPHGSQRVNPLTPGHFLIGGALKAVEKGEDHTDNQEYESTAFQEENYLQYDYENQTEVYKKCSLTQEQE